VWHIYEIDAVEVLTALVRMTSDMRGAGSCSESQHMTVEWELTVEGDASDGRKTFTCSVSTRNSIV
jgi:hypothetical protein